MAYGEGTAKELRARYEREWNELCEHMKHAGPQLGGLARHATLETRLRACQARLKVYQDGIGVLRRGSRGRPLRRLGAGARRNHRRY
jgi:hypothetical protein